MRTQGHPWGAGASIWHRNFMEGGLWREFVGSIHACIMVDKENNMRSKALNRFSRYAQPAPTPTMGGPSRGAVGQVARYKDGGKIGDKKTCSRKNYKK